MEKEIYNRIRNIYLHNFMWYYSNKITVDELCMRVRKMDRLFNPDSEYFGSERYEVEVVLKNLHY